jgi:hypothetical protein
VHDPDGSVAATGMAIRALITYIERGAALWRAR